MNINNVFKERDTRLEILDFLKFVPDKPMLKLEYWMKIGKTLDLKNPRGFNEKIQWLKLHDRKDIYTVMADKYGVREYIKDQIGEEYLVPIYGCWNSVDEIPFAKLPERFVLKCTHDSGSVILCQDKKKLDIPAAKEKLNKRMGKSAFWWAREWPYKNITPRIIAEEYMTDGTTPYLPVYKFFCFGGEPRMIQQIQNDKQEDECVDYFNANWERLELKQRFPNSLTPMPKPEKLDKMLEITRKLSQGISFLRVDLYLINGKIYFSENTFYPDAGYSVFEPEEWDIKLGDWIELPEISTNKGRKQK